MKTHSEYDFDDIDFALKHTEKILLEKKVIKKPVYSTSETNHKRHRFLLCNDGTRIYFMFKREPLNQWLKLFPQLNEIEGNVWYVDSINIDLYYEAVRRFFNDNETEGFFIICYADGTILKIRVREWLKRANEQRLYRRIRRLNTVKAGDYSGSDEYIDEKTMSCFFTQEDVVN